MERIQEEMPFVRVLSESSRVEFQQLVLHCSKQRVEVICEIIINILNRTIDSTDQNMKDLLKHRRVLTKLTRPDLTVKERKTIIRRNAMLVQETITYFLPRLEKLLLQDSESSESEDANSPEEENDFMESGSDTDDQDIS